MRKITFFKTMLAAVLLLVGSVATAQVTLAGWELNGLSSYGPSPMTPTTADANLTTVGLTRGSGFLTSGTPASNAWGGLGLNETSKTAAIEGNDFATFSITANAGYTVSVSGINAYNIRRSSTGPTSGQWQYQIGAGSFVDIGSVITWGTVTTSAGNPQTAIDLSSIGGLQNVAAGTTITFRCVIWGGSASTGTWYLNNFQTGEDLVVTGTVTAAGGTPFASLPTYSVVGEAKSVDTYWNAAAVTINTATEGAAVYYTTNGSVPTTASTLFSAPVNITSTTTFKAIAVKDGMNNSAVAEKTINIAPTASATVPYTEAFNNTLGDWYSYKKAGDKPWGPSTNGAYVNGFGGGDVESWLISPQFTSPLAGLAFTFNYASRYTGNPLLVKYSTNYSGYGDPTTATWVSLTSIAAPETQDNNYTVKASGTINIPVSGMVHLALVYDTEANYSDWRITNASVSVAQSPNAPTITVTEMSVPAMSAEVGQSDTETITVGGVNLSGNISIEVSGANAAYFTANPASLTAVSGTVTDAAVVITYAPLAAGSHTATLTLSSAGAISVTRSLTGTATVSPVQMTPPDVIITEVYGGGGNSGATLKNDFIELYNTTASEVNISGWSVQYFAATGTTAGTTNKFVIPDGKSIPAKSHFLIQAAAGSGGTEDLVSPDAVSEIGASGTVGKIILFTSDVDITISDIASITGNAAFKDYVPYGTTAVPVWGSAMSANTANTTSASRRLIGGSYSYTQNIGYDFEIVTPNPQNALWTSVQNPKLRTDVYTLNGTIRFNATAGQTVEVYTVIGQQIISTLATDGLNIIPVKAKGMMVVKIGGKSAKVVM